MKTPQLHAATRNPIPEPSAKNSDFNLRRVLFYHGIRSRLFQQNRPKAVAAFVIAEGFVLGLESTKVIKTQIAESLYVAYDDAASYLAIESKG
ncbi:hypothetical protein [Pseudomonas orientalis]|uniref:hypothetical protein n=1 Tax=Pseudomonas orientalis TaxID=76758 RepID=UPI0030D88E3B